MKISKLPNLRNVGATRKTTAHLSFSTSPVYNLSLFTVYSDINRLPALVVGIPSEYIASEHKNSLTDDLSTARPSAYLE